MPAILGVRVFGGGGGLKPCKTSLTNSHEEFADEFVDKFAGNFPNFDKTKIKTQHTSALQKRGINILKPQELPPRLRPFY